ncbi:glycosyltransferase family 87 protein [Salinactinospora qingdaonensis]|uniref:Glycosyltransferase 87 family protein n=1 Tax=Salinactinospora qingdaonensis TaxID=702744 RepID=A0ABP7F835_9ACTN
MAQRLTGGAGDDVAGTVHSPTQRQAFPWPQLVGVAALGALLGYLLKAPCRFGGAWVDGTQFAKACYTDVFPLYYRDELDAGTVPYLDKPVEYPVLTGELMHVLARAVSWLPDATSRGYAYFDLTALVMAVCLTATVLGVGWLAGHGGIAAAGSPDGALFDHRRALAAGAFTALVPAALLAAYINWDMLAVALLIGGLVSYARGREWSAGALIGLAVSAKFYPFLFFGPLFVLAVRDRFRHGRSWQQVGGDLGRPLGAAVLTWVAVNLPIYLVAPQGWAEFFTFSRERGADWGSIYYLLGEFDLFDTANLDLVNLVGTGSLVVACAGVALLGLFARRRPPLEQLVFLVVAAFLMTNKVWSPQFVLWLLPLAALAWPRNVGRWPALLVFGAWQVAEVGYILGIWQYLLSFSPPEGAPDAGIGVGLYAVVLLGRLFSLLAVCVLLVVDCLRSGDSQA